MPNGADDNDRPCPDRHGCAWTPHNYKHFPHQGLKREFTRHGPAKYLPEVATSDAAIRQLETLTVATGNRVAPTPNKSEYRRETGQVIGYDLGKEATLSFAECSGGTTAGRVYHGRPMCSDNPNAAEDAGDGDG